MRVYVLPNSQAIAEKAADLVGKVLSENPSARIGVATGSSPLELYKTLGERVSTGQLSFELAEAVALDEYIGLPAEHSESYRSVVRKEFTSRVNINPANVHNPDGTAPDPLAEAARYEALVRSGEGVALQILGIGHDGHIGFNEPGGSLSSTTHLGVLTEETRQANARFFEGNLDAVPTHCITQGLSTIMAAKATCLIATGKGKARAIAQLVEGPVSARWPATILQHHPECTVLLDEDAASELELRDHYAQCADIAP